MGLRTETRWGAQFVERPKTCEHVRPRKGRPAGDTVAPTALWALGGVLRIKDDGNSSSCSVCIKIELMTEILVVYCGLRCQSTTSDA